MGGLVEERFTAALSYWGLSLGIAHLSASKGYLFTDEISIEVVVCFGAISFENKIMKEHNFAGL